jgi:hypothetical protein
MMRLGLVRVLSAMAIGATLAICALPALARTAKECKADYAAHKDAIKALGETEKVYIETCKAGPDAPGSGAASSGPSDNNIAKACDADYVTNKDAVSARGESKKDFLASCRAAMEASQPAAAPQTTAPPPADAAAK